VLGGGSSPLSSLEVFCCPEDVDALVAEAGSLYGRIMGHDPADRSCGYLFSR